MTNVTFRSKRTHTRLIFSPLTVSCSLVCLTPQSPMAQSVNTNLAQPEFEPNRNLNPTVVRPEVRGSDKDRIFPAGLTNRYLSLDSIKWTVNGVPIDTAWNREDYEIVSSEDDMRGALRIKKNIPAGSEAVLKFSAKFLDYRTGIIYNVCSNEQALVTTDKSEDEIRCCVDKPFVVWNPLYDNLLLYEYKKANKIPVFQSRDEVKDGKCYEQRVHILLTEGSKELKSLPAGMIMQLYDIGNNAAVVPGSIQNLEVRNISYPFIDFDMRLVSSKEYEVRFLQDGKLITKASISCNTTVSTPFDGRPVKGADLAANQTEYSNAAIVSLRDRVIDFPDLYYDIRWITQAAQNREGQWTFATPKEWQHGRLMSCKIKDIGMGITKNDSFFDIWFEITPHDISMTLTDESGSVLTDENGNILIS